MTAPLHDIGKLGIPDSILNKPGKLTEEEFDTMKSHSLLGYEILQGLDSEMMKMAAVIAREHHEKYDGSGYPQGLKGEEINIYARITIIADVFDALGCDRVYKRAWKLEEILEYFRQEKGRHFDPQLVDLFLQHREEVFKIRKAFGDCFTE